VVFLETRIEEIVVEARGGLLRHGDRLRVLLQFRHVLRRMSPLQGVQVAVASVLTLPKQILPKRFGQLGREHVSAGCARGEGRLLRWMGVGGGHDDRFRI